MNTNEQQTRLMELAERIETAAMQARHELEPLRPNREGYTDRPYSELLATLDRLRDGCDAIRYGLERDRHVS